MARPVSPVAPTTVTDIGDIMVRTSRPSSGMRKEKGQNQTRSLSLYRLQQHATPRSDVTSVMRALAVLSILSD